MNKFAAIVCALSLVACGTGTTLSGTSLEEQQEIDVRCNEPGLNEFDVEALVDYTFAEDVVYNDGREGAFMASALIHACTDISIIAPMLTISQGNEDAQNPQDPDDATGLLLGADAEAFSDVTPILDNDAAVAVTVEYSRHSDTYAGFKTVLREPIQMRAGDARFISFKVSITRNPQLVGSTQDFKLLPGVVYRTVSGVCSGESGCAPNSVPIGSAPVLTVRYR